MMLESGSVKPNRQAAGRIFLAFIVVFFYCALAILEKPVHAAGTEMTVPPAAFYVDTTDDDGELSTCSDAAWDCSLRGAINKANSTPGGDTIYLPAGTYRLSGYLGEDKNETGDLDILAKGGNLTIYGEGMDRTIISGNRIDRVVHTPDFYSPITISLNSFSIQDGNAPGSTDGGGVRSYASLYLNNVRIANNMARNGAGLYLYATQYNTLTIENSIISDNYAWKDGAGLYLWAYDAAIKNSAIYRNTAVERGGGVFNDTQLTVTTSTFYGNTAEDGGGLFNWAFLGDRTTADLLNCTFSMNSEAVDIHVDGMNNNLTEGVVKMSNTIVSNSTSGDNCEKDVKSGGNARYENGGSNLDSGITCGFGGNKGSQFGADPMLGELEDNGGPTPTLALLDGSPAINQGNPSSCPHRDQRGLASVEICDVGAFEYNAQPYLMPSVGMSKTEMNGVYGNKLAVTVRNAYGNPLAGWRVGFDTPDYLWVTLSSAQEISDENGYTAITANNSDISGKPKLVNATAGPASAQFSLNGLYATAYLYSGMPYFLPLTGFAPGTITRVADQPDEAKYTDVGEMQLEIPSLGVGIPIVGVPKVNGDWDLSWLGDSAGYLEGTAFPTWNGTSALTAHVVRADGTPGPFSRLGELKWGDRVVINAWGSQYEYEVRSVSVVSPDDMSVLGHEELSWLTLITCQDYDLQNQQYASRLVVKAVLVAIKS